MKIVIVLMVDNGEVMFSHKCASRPEPVFSV